MRFRGRKRFRGRRRRFFRRKLRRFDRRVKGALGHIYRTKRMVIYDSTGTNVNLMHGDGVTRSLQIINICRSFAQGPAQSQVTYGDRVFIKSIAVKGMLDNARLNSTGYSLKVRFWLFWSAQQMSQASFQTFGNTTTAVLNPAQTDPDANPQIYADTAQPFVSRGYQDRFDTTRIKVLKTKVVPFNTQGVLSQKFLKWKWNIKRNYQFEDTDDALTGPGATRGRYGTYYFAYQVYYATGTAGITNTVDGGIDMKIDVYFTQA